jgi:GT2 family glycosyltransferase
MVYIILLNWKGASDTLACLDSLAHLYGVKYRLVICDNASPDNSYEKIRAGIQSSAYYAAAPLVELNREHAERYVISADEQNTIFLIQTGDNLGYAGGNNVGIRFSLNQNDMKYVWILNNDTLVEPDALALMVNACNDNPEIGICGCKLIYEYDRDKLQGLGGVYNSWLGTNYHYAANLPATSIFNNDDVSEKIDYVIGASMLLSKALLSHVGLLCEDYFLYFEELDITYRARKYGYRHYVVTKAIVYHKEGGSTGHCNNKSTFSDSLAIKNRILFSIKFHPYKLPFVWSGLWVALFNRLRRNEVKKAIGILKVIFPFIIMKGN